MTETNLHALYQEVLDRVLQDDLRLPSLPDITMKVREAISAENTTCESLTEIISRDPALTAYLVQAASSPLYRRAVPPKALADVVGLLGFSATNSLVMLHSVRDMVELKDATAKKLFNYTWERLVVKTSVASFLAQQFKFRPVDHVQMAMLLTEIGSLATLSAILETSQTPDEQTYFQMCRQYSKSIGCAVLTKWQVDPKIIDMLGQCGHWEQTWEDKLSLLDIANLALYYTVRLTSDKPSLPKFESLAAYSKIPKELAKSSKPDWLDLISDNREEIQNIISSFK